MCKLYHKNRGDGKFNWLFVVGFNQYFKVTIKPKQQKQ